MRGADDHINPFLGQVAIRTFFILGGKNGEFLESQPAYIHQAFEFFYVVIDYQDCLHVLCLSSLGYGECMEVRKTPYVLVCRKKKSKSKIFI